MELRVEAETEDPAVQLTTMGLSYQVAWMISVLVRMEIPRRLVDGPRTCDQLAAETGAQEDGLRRLLRAGASVGLLEQVGEKRFGLGPAGRCLVPGAESLEGFGLMLGDTWRHRPFELLLEGVTTGHPTAREALGTDFQQYYQAHPEHLAAMTRHLDAMATAVIPRLLAAYDVSGAERIVDVGGGRGILLAAMLGAAPHATGVLVERPPAFEVARRRLAEAGVLDRVELSTGDVLTELPAGGDLYVLKQALHNRDDALATRVLGNCASAMRAGGRVLLLEGMLPADRPGPPFMHFMDLSMLLLTGGRERTQAELEALAGSTGLALTRTARVPLPFWPEYYLLELRRRGDG